MPQLALAQSEECHLEMKYAISIVKLRRVGVTQTDVISSITAARDTPYWDEEDANKMLQMIKIIFDHNSVVSDEDAIEALDKVLAWCKIKNSTQA